MTTFGDAIVYAHNNIAPFSFSAMLVFASSINNYTSYLFLIAFLLWFVISIARFILLIYRHGILRWLWDNIRHYSILFWEKVLELKDLYWIKVIIGILVPYAVASTCYWLYHHFDLIALLRATWEFIINIPTYLLDSRLLIAAIHRWLNKMFLSHVVSAMTSIWTITKDILLNDPLLGVFIIILTIVAIISLFLIGSWLKFMCSELYNDWTNNNQMERARTRRVRAED